MMRLAQAASSEYFSAWGVPPNQRRTGVTKAKPEGNLDGELNIVSFYSGWTACYRATDAAIAEKIAWIMERAVANGSYIGYGQNNGNYPRTGVFDTLAKISDRDPAKISTLCNCDCSSLVGAATYYAGVTDSKLKDMWTGSMRSVLLGTGKFVEITDTVLLQSGKGLKRGDILWKKGHTAVALDTDLTTDTTPCRIANCKACNFREGPGTEYGIIDALSVGTRVDLVSTASNGWAQMIYAGTYGYISPKYYAVLPSVAGCTERMW